MRPCPRVSRRKLLGTSGIYSAKRCHRWPLVVRYHVPMPSKFSVSLALLGSAHLHGALAAEYFVYTGSYTRGASKGIYVFRFDSATGRMSPPVLAGETPNPAF